MKRLPTLLLVLLATSPVSPASAAPGTPPPATFEAEAAPGSSTSSTGGWFLLRAAVGSSARQALTLRNTATRPTELVIDPVDAVTSVVGGASYGLPGEPVTRTGTWVQPGRERVLLAPGEEVVVPFTVTVPVGAVQGDHLAGLSVSAPAEVSQSAAGAAEGPDTLLDLSTRRVIAVQVEVPGEAEPRLDVSGVLATVKPTGAQLEVALTNSGRRLTKGTGVLTVAGTGTRTEFPLDTFVPGTSIAYPLPWPEGITPGQHDAQVELSYGPGRTARWSGALVVDDEQVDAAARDTRSAEAGAASAAPASGGGPSTGLLAAGVAGGIVLALAGQAGLRRLRGRRPVV